MNLAKQSWIPVTELSGAARRVSLREVFTKGQELADLSVRPHERIALMRLLLCIAHRALKGPKDSAALERAVDELPDAAAAYLDEQAGCFELFDPVKPFLQFPGLAKPPKPAGKKAKKTAPVEDEEEEEAKTTSKLCFFLASADAATLFDNHAATDVPRCFDPEWLALNLITYQCFSLGGTMGAAIWRGKPSPGAFTKADGSLKGQGKSSHAPCVPSSMLHSFIRCDNVLQTVAANLVTITTVEQAYGKPFGEKPVWEWFPSSFDDHEAISNATTTFLGRLVPLSRAILLKPDGSGLVLANGLDYPTPPEFPPEPSATLVAKSDGSGHYLLGLASNRAIWRELHAITVKRKVNEVGGPLVLSQFDSDLDVDVWTGALEIEKGSKAIVLDAWESVYRIPPRLFNNEGRLSYEEEVRHAGSVARSLGGACMTYRQLLALELKPKFPEKHIAERRYWTEVEQRAPLLLKHLRMPEGSEEAAAVLTEWRRALRKAAFAALEASCPSETARQQRAYALALRELQIECAPKKKKETNPEQSPS